MCETNARRCSRVSEAYVGRPPPPTKNVPNHFQDVYHDDVVNYFETACFSPCRDTGHDADGKWGIFGGDEVVPMGEKGDGRVVLVEAVSLC